MRKQFDSRRWFDHKGSQFHNQKKQNAISDKSCLDKAVKAGTKCPATKQSSIVSIVSRTKRRKYDVPDNVASLHKEYKVEGGEDSRSQAEPNYEISTSKSSKISCEVILQELISKDY